MFLREKAAKTVAAFGAALAVGISSLGVARADVMRLSSVPDTGGFTIDARGAVVLDARTGRVLFAQSAERELPMASTTKIMSALLTLEQPNLHEYFVVDTQAIMTEGSSMGLREGDEVSLYALAQGMLLSSGNDGANAAAVRIAGSIPAFAELMNERVRAMGLSHTQFANPSGLDDKGHYSSAYDMALLTREALQNELFRKICSSRSMVASYGSPPYSRTLKNHNRLLALYSYAIGVKTGFTSAARRCLVTAAEKDGVTLIIVTLAAADDFNTHRRLYERFFAEAEVTGLSQELSGIAVPVVGGRLAEAVAVPTGSMTALLLTGERARLRLVVEAPKFLYAPLPKDAIIGTVKLYSGQTLVYASRLKLAEAVERDPRGMNLLERLMPVFD